MAGRASTQKNYCHSNYVKLNVQSVRKLKNNQYLKDYLRFSE